MHGKTLAALGFANKGESRVCTMHLFTKGRSHGEEQQNLGGRRAAAPSPVAMASSAGPSGTPPPPPEGESSQPKEPEVSLDYTSYFLVTKRFENGHVGGKCNFCKWDPKETFPRRVLAHIGRVGGEGVNACPGDVPQKVVDAYKVLCRQAAKRTASPTEPVRSHKKKTVADGSPGIGSFLSRGGSTGSSQGTGGSRLKQTTIAGRFSTEQKAEVDRAVARFCYGTGVPFNVFASPYWGAVCSAIAQYGKSSGGVYKPPSVPSLRTTLLAEEKANVQKVMESLRGGDSDYGITICTDAYTSKRGAQYMNFVAVTVNGMEFLFSEDTTEVEKKTGEYIAGLLCKAVEMVGPKKVVQTCTDNAAACKLAGEIVMQRYPHITHTPCTAHCLDLLLEDWGEMLFAKELCEKGASIVRLIRRYGAVRRVFKAAAKEHCKGLELIRPVVTRFATQFLMLERLQKLKVAVKLTAAHPAWEEASLRSGDPLTEGLADDVGGRAFWDQVDMVLKLMEPVFSLLRLTDGEAPCMGKIYWRMWNVFQQVQSAVEGAGEVGELVDRESLEGFWLSRWNGMHSPLQGTGYALEPEHRDDKWNRNEEVMRDYRLIAAKLLGAELVVKAVEQLLKYKKAVLSPDALQAMKEMFGYEWWEAWGSPWPLPQILAMKVLSLCSSATSCERVWSTYGFIGSARRGKLTSQRLNDLVYNFSNLKVMEKARKPDGLMKLAPQWWEAKRMSDATGAATAAEDVESEDGSDLDESSDEREVLVG